MSALDDIEKLLSSMKDRGAEMKAFEGLLTEISASLADIVSNLEKPKAVQAERETAAALVKALNEGLSKLKAPVVTVAAPTGQDWKSLRVKVNKSADGSKEFLITKT